MTIHVLNKQIRALISDLRDAREDLTAARAMRSMDEVRLHKRRVERLSFLVSHNSKAYAAVNLGE